MKDFIQGFFTIVVIVGLSVFAFVWWFITVIIIALIAIAPYIAIFGLIFYFGNKLL